MGNNQKTLSLEIPLDSLKNIFIERGYPPHFFIENLNLEFSYKNLNFYIFIPLIIKENSQFLFIIDYKPQKNLTVAERGILALSRVFFTPLPYFALITNFEEFILIDLYSGKKQKGTKDIIPTYKELQNYKPTQLKPFKIEIEKKILAIYLSCGCKGGTCRL